MRSQVAITKARARLGPESLAELYARACVPLAIPGTKGTFHRQRRVVAIDGTAIDVADTEATELERAGTDRGDGSAFPQLRFVAVGEAGTHAVIAAETDSYATGEDRKQALHLRCLLWAPDGNAPNPFIISMNPVHHLYE